MELMNVDKSAECFVTSHAALFPYHFQQLKLKCQDFVASWIKVTFKFEYEKTTRKKVAST